MDRAYMLWEWTISSWICAHFQVKWNLGFYSWLESGYRKNALWWSWSGFNTEKFCLPVSYQLFSYQRAYRHLHGVQKNRSTVAFHWHLSEARIGQMLDPIFLVFQWESRTNACFEPKQVDYIEAFVEHAQSTSSVKILSFRICWIACHWESIRSIEA